MTLCNNQDLIIFQYCYCMYLCLLYLKYPNRKDLSFNYDVCHFQMSKTCFISLLLQSRDGAGSDDVASQFAEV